MFMYSEHSDWFVDKEILKGIPNDSSLYYKLQSIIYSLFELDLIAVPPCFNDSVVVDRNKIFALKSF